MIKNIEGIIPTKKYSIADAARLVSKSRGTLYNRVKAGYLKISHNKLNQPYILGQDLIRCNNLYL